MPSSIRARKRQEQDRILSYDKVVPVDRPAGRGAGTGADLEVKRPSLLTASKMAATSYRLRRVFGPHGIDRYNLYPDTDQVPVQWEQQHSCCSMLSTYIFLFISFTSLLLPKLLFESPTPPYSLQ
jgi:hypothetical protein